MTFNITRALAITATVLTLVGCGGGAGAPKPAQANKVQPLPPALREGTYTNPQAVGTPARQNKPAAPANSGMPDIPAGAQWTILCQTIPGDGHVERANRLKEQLIQQTKMRDWYVIHQDGQSTLYYGFYKAFNDPKENAESQRAQRDRKTIDGLADRLGNRPFKFAFFVALDAPDPAAPPEWNLTTASGAYSLQIAAYTGHPLRKQAAVEAVRAARENGLEAYYYHGETTSSVCVGSFPETAVRRTHAVANQTRDPDQPVMVTDIPLSDQTASMQRDPQGRPIRVEQEKYQIIDPKLAELMRRFPEHAVNGELQVQTMVDPATGQKIAKAPSSFLVPIPRGESVLSGDSTAGTSVQGLPEDRPIVAPRQSEQPGMGKLRGLP
jgi:hypothetical protein